MIEYLKLAVSELIHKQNIINNPFPKQSKEREIFSLLKKEGCYVYESFLSEERCEELRKKANEFLKTNKNIVSKESNGADLRVYGIDKYTKEFNVEECLKLSNKIFQKFSFTINKDHLVLLGKIKASDNNLGSGSGWHRDSPFTHQFKTILYLSDVTEENGPFQYIKGSHKYNLIKKYSKRLGKKIGNYRFRNDEIDFLVKEGVVNKPTKVIGKAGTLLFADVRGLHRGSPLIKDERYALTNYHFVNKVRSKYYGK